MEEASRDMRGCSVYGVWGPNPAGLHQRSSGPRSPTAPGDNLPEVTIHIQRAIVMPFCNHPVPFKQRQRLSLDTKPVFVCTGDSVPDTSGFARLSQDMGRFEAGLKSNPASESRDGSSTPGSFKEQGAAARSAYESQGGNFC